MKTCGALLHRAKVPPLRQRKRPAPLLWLRSSAGLVETHAQEVAQRRAYNLTRNYHYPPFTKALSVAAPSQRSPPASTFLPPQLKTFAILQSTGGHGRSACVRQTLEREVELAHDPSVSQIHHGRIYDFALAGEDSLNGKRCYVFGHAAQGANNQRLDQGPALG